MKFVSAFSRFLENEVNLNKTRFDVAKSGIDTITAFLENNEFFGEKFINTSPQGSFRQETIIKPCQDHLDFDVDILFEMQKVDGWDAKDYLEKLAQEFKNTDRYKEKVDMRGKNRCVTIDYENDFHIDIIPMIDTIGGCLIMNKKENLFEATDGDGYAEWFQSKNNIVGNKFLTKTVRLLKYIRDSKNQFEAKSIVLTTLLGNQIYESDDKSQLYADLPTAFLNIIKRLDTFLLANTQMPLIQNPVLASETFNRHWNQDKYNNFRSKIHSYAEQAQDAYDDTNAESSLKKWQKIFGDAFKEELKFSLRTAIRAVMKRDKGEEFLADKGISEDLKFSVKIDATVTQDGFPPFSLLRSANPLRKHRKLQFYINSCNVPKPYEIKWKIKNTGEEATAKGDLRGKIYDGGSYGTHDETTKYHGEHYAECYIIKDNICVAKDRLHVPIGTL